MICARNASSDGKSANTDTSASQIARVIKAHADKEGAAQPAAA
jgi:hypothetical protein